MAARAVVTAGHNGGVTELSRRTFRAPVGEISVTCSPAGITRVRFGHPAALAVSQAAAAPRDGQERQASQAAAAGQESRAVQAPQPEQAAAAGREPQAGREVAPGGAAALAERAERELAEYFAGRRRVFGVPVDWSVVDGAQRDVLRALVERVGYGTTITYGALAAAAGLTGPEPGGPVGGGTDLPARVVGQVMASNPFALVVPCHRVVASDGIGGYSGGTGVEVKRWLLIFEGAVPATLDWDPAGPVRF
jgi:methylated-DNA-[protein]-cysteine S-methyltransferase